MKEENSKHNNVPIPIRLENGQLESLKIFQYKTGLSKAFIIRHCISYALEKFINGEVNVITLRNRGD